MVFALATSLIVKLNYIKGCGFIVGGNNGAITVTVVVKNSSLFVT